MKRAILLLVAIMAVAVPGSGQSQTNRVDRLESFRDLGFGLFVHWSVDSQLGSVISHSMVGADEAYLDRFMKELPRTFNPRKFEPRDWAVLAKLSGARYVVFTTKHHSGFCMFDTATTDFGIMHTPFHRDITGELFSALREQGIVPGVYFSPDDFWWLSRNGVSIQRGVPNVQPRAHPGLMAHDQAQVRELMTKYGPVGVVFFDGEAEGLRELAWQLQPETVVTRGAIKTPEQNIPGAPMDEAWESCFTMGTQWQYKPTNEKYKSGSEVISMLIETRAKGGNLLLNIGPKPDGEIPIEQEERLRELALWMFVNSECIYGVRPWIVTNEGENWFTRKKDTDTLYLIVNSQQRWPYGEWKDIVLHSVRATDHTGVSVLSQNDQTLEYQPTVTPKTTWKQQADGLHIRAMRAQRLYNDRKWPNPVVLKLNHVEAALVPPRVATKSARWNAQDRRVECTGELLTMGDAKSVEVGAEYRDITGLDVNERGEDWIATARTVRTKEGPFTVDGPALQPGRRYEVRVVVKHPLLTVYGGASSFKIP